MRNLFTRFLGQWSDDEEFAEFVSYWDRLESTTIEIYRHTMTPDEARSEFEVVWPWLLRSYPKWRRKLSAYWPRTSVAGQPTQTDPFRLLLEASDPESIIDNWRLMQYLPAAREAINQYLLRE